MKSNSIPSGKEHPVSLEKEPHPEKVEVLGPMESQKDFGIPEADVSASNATGQTSFIGADHPRDGRDWDAQCARCGSSLDWILCEACVGEGITGPGELYEEDPLWYDLYDYEPCHPCGGEASWPECISNADWCNANPLKGRENVKRSTPEWFVIAREASSVPSGTEKHLADSSNPNS